MLIRSQNKENLISLDSITYLQIITKEDGRYAIWVVCGYGDDFILAFYSTMDKAKAVLDEIQYNYERNKDAEYLGAGGPHIRSSVFQMPDDDDPWFVTQTRSGHGVDVWDD